ncbi:MAG: Gfo/Idh/MocA family oxidoreductase [Deltaproteobacteria bacterium]|nr:Gfo/Idh/MocA family oxidoreductase [Deltaproteobacteria bacterium]
MITHPPLSVLIISKGPPSPLDPLIAYFQRIPSLSLSISPELPRDLSSFQVIIAADSANCADPSDPLFQYLLKGGGWLGLIQDAGGALPEFFGVQPTPAGPFTELRVSFQDHDHPLARRLPDSIYLNGRYRGLEITADNTETILYADWRSGHIPVLTRRPLGNGQIACTTLAVFDDSNFQQILFRLLQGLAGRQVRDQWLGVGLLGYSPNVGKKHGRGVMATPGLRLKGLCDLNPKRLRQAEEDFPGITTYPSVENFTRSADIDLVIICTPPSTHARLSLEMMAAGKHVLSEKPLALNRKETDAMVEMADRRKVHLNLCRGLYPSLWILAFAR